MLKSLSFIILLIPSILLASINVKNTPVPGGIAVIEFETNHSNPKGFYGDIAIYLQKIQNNKWQALVGIPILASPGVKHITIKDFSTRKIEFEVVEYKYEEQHITLKGKKKKYVNPNLKHMDRIKSERPILSNARKTYTEDALAKGKFIRPVDGITTSEFGLKRFYNGQPRRAHTGLDFAGSIGTEIKAPAQGRVILTGNYFFNGNAVFIDHGKGLISVYIHMNKINVSNNQLVNKGDIIGTIGKTGRSTGPHLHWGVYLNQTAVNPRILLGNNNEI